MVELKTHQEVLNYVDENPYKFKFMLPSIIISFILLYIMQKTGVFHRISPLGSLALYGGAVVGMFMQRKTLVKFHLPEKTPSIKKSLGHFIGWLLIYIFVWAFYSNEVYTARSGHFFEQLGLLMCGYFFSRIVMSLILAIFNKKARNYAKRGAAYLEEIKGIYFKELLEGDDVKYTGHLSICGGADGLPTAKEFKQQVEEEEKNAARLERKKQNELIKEMQESLIKEPTVAVSPIPKPVSNGEETREEKLARLAKLKELREKQQQSKQ